MRLTPMARLLTRIDHAETEALRSEVAQLRRELASLREQVAMVSARPWAAFPPANPRDQVSAMADYIAGRYGSAPGTRH